MQGGERATWPRPSAATAAKAGMISSCTWETRLGLLGLFFGLLGIFIDSPKLHGPRPVARSKGFAVGAHGQCVDPVGRRLPMPFDPGAVRGPRVAALLQMLEQHSRHHPAEMTVPEIRVRTHLVLSASSYQE